MKQVPWIFLFFCLSLTAAGQRNSDYGVFAGVSSYLGDINPNRLMYSPLPAGGVFYRYNFHPRHALRGNIFFGGLKGDDLDFKNSFQVNRAASFSGLVGELAVQFEFNFLPFTTQGKLWDFSPYFAAGAGVAFINSASVAFQPVIPFSAGFKVNIYKNMGLEAEYGFRKTFYDNFDGLNDLVAPSDFAWLHNNDWYSFAGIALTWKIFNTLVGCPAYSDVDGKRRR
ncbi:MAG: hypothetical protein A2V50_06960 [Bacteroidetes bacterium RBG_19FT_COMBO_42_10]|nr:MAG: hypothetical protein A2V50_06960 [Bacteroidetes bacterium RBG_19FT_COMBO_42_10]